jgi:hypothetical protein
MKCAGKACVGLWGYSCGPRELLGLGGPSLEEAGCYSTPCPSPLEAIHGWADDFDDDETRGQKAYACCQSSGYALGLGRQR